MSGLVKSVVFCGQSAAIACDGKCNKAWGINTRPKEELDPNNPDDYAFLADDELGEAPVDPGTSEGDHLKPQQPEDRMNKWCARECERSSMHGFNDHTPFEEFGDFSNRVYNCAKHRKAS